VKKTERARTSPTRAARVLNDFIGHIHSARCSQAIWLRVLDDPRYRIAAKYGLQAAFGMIALTLRKFEDFYSEDFHLAIPERSRRPPEAKWLLQESQKRNLRSAANVLIAHYKDKSRAIPSASEITKLIERGGWETDEELMAWAASVMDRLEAVRDAVMAYHGLSGLDD